MRTRLRRRGSVSTVVLAVALAAHFTVVLLSLLPEGPAHSRVERVARWYTDPLFNQDWRLFAPNPVRDDQGTLLRVRYPDGSVSRWVDPLSPLIAKNHSNPLLATKDLDLLRSVGLLESTWEDPELADRRDRRVAQAPESSRSDPAYRFEVIPLTDPEKRAKAVSDGFRATIASHYATMIFGAGYSDVQMRTVILPARPYPIGKPIIPESRPEKWDFDWQPKVSS